jgi:hypothetical protein
MPKSFVAKLFKYPGKGGWTFAPVPKSHAPEVTRGWGRTPVTATVDGHQWETSVWRGKNGETLLPVPKKVRGSKKQGDTVTVTLSFLAKDSTLKSWLGAGHKQTGKPKT